MFGMPPIDHTEGGLVQSTGSAQTTRTRSATLKFLATRLSAPHYARRRQGNKSSAKRLQEVTFTHHPGWLWGGRNRLIIGATTSGPPLMVALLLARLNINLRQFTPCHSYYALAHRRTYPASIRKYAPLPILKARHQKAAGYLIRLQASIPPRW